MILPLKNCFILFIACVISIHLKGQSVGGTTSGGATYCDSTNSGFISLTGNTGTYFWESSSDGGITWSSTGSSNTPQSYFSLTQTVCFRAIVQDGAFPPDTSTTSCVTVFLPSVGGTIGGGGTFCATSGAGTLNLSGNNGNVLSWQFSINNGLSWTTVSNTTTTLNYSGITQNTIYTAVVQNGPTCPTDTSSQVSFVIDAMTNGGTMSGNDTVCSGLNSGTVNLSGIVGSVITWVSSTDNGSTWTLIPNITSIQVYSNLNDTTFFSAVVQNGVCPVDTSGFAVITVLSPPFVDAGADTTIILGQSVNLNGTGNGSPVWIPSTGLSGSTIFSPVATPVSTTSYVLTVTDTNGCVNTDALVITIIPPEFNGMVSNLFTPNGDGINDYWYIQDIQNFPDNEVIIYNIYGNQVYSGKGYKNDWQGTYNGAPLPDGTYFYVLKFEDPEKILKGSIDILRSK